MTSVDRIPIAHSVVYAVRGVPEVADEYNAERTIAPHEISLTYRTTEDSQLGRVHAYVKGWWMQDGARVPMDKPVGRHFWGRNFADWPEWLAEEARIHDPDAAVDPPADQTHGLSVQHADALWDAVAIPGPATPTFPEQHERVCRAVAGIIDEVAAIVPPNAQADILRDAADVAEAENSSCNAVGPCQQCSARTSVAIKLRRMADEAQPGTKPISPPKQRPTVAYNDGMGSGRVFCLTCSRPEDVDTPLDIDSVEHWDLCPSCGRYVVDVARALPLSGTVEDPS